MAAKPKDRDAPADRADQVKSARLPRSAVSAELVAQYRATHYHVGSGTQAFVLCVDGHSAGLARMLAAFRCRCAAYVTACNPQSELHTDEENRAAHARLRAELNAAGVPFVEGAAVDPRGTWPDEKSILALGLGLEAARATGMRFGQNALLWSAEDAVPRLILLR